jgi:hypothetical protein
VGLDGQGRALPHRGQEEERKRFFFERKNQKTFSYQGFALSQRAREVAKVFASFFKKKRFLPTIIPGGSSAPRG